MFSPFERMLAFRYLRARKAEGFVSVIAGFSFLGIMLGVATLIIVMSVMNGFRSELITRMLGLNGHLNVYGANGPLIDYKVLALKLGDIPGVVSAAPLVEGQALLSTGDRAGGVMVRGFDPKDFAKKPVISSSIKFGSLKEFGGTNVAVGIKLADHFGLRVGETMTLIAPRGKAGPFGMIPRSQTFHIAAIFDVGMFEFNNSFVFMPLQAAQTFFQMPDTANSIEMITTDPGNLDHIKQMATQVAAGQAGVYDWQASNTTFFNALKVERNVMFLILTLIILVAAFNIISSMIMLVKDKSRDIAIMRTMGATRGSILRIFLLTGSSIGFSGTFIGAVSGVLFAMNIEGIRQLLQKLTGTELFSDEIYFLSQLPARVEFGDVSLVVGLAFGLSLLATIYPAWRAARLDPVEAIRYE